MKKSIFNGWVIGTLLLAATATSANTGTHWDNMTHDERIVQAKKLGEGIGKGLLLSRTMSTKEVSVADSNLKEKCSEVANANTLFRAHENAADYMKFVVNECIIVISENNK